MASHDLRSLVQQHYDGMRDGDFDSGMAVFTPDCVTSDPGGGPMDRAQARTYAEAFKAAVPDARMEIRRVVESPGVCVVEGTFVGTHTGPLVGPAGELPPTGRPVALEYCDVFVERDGLIAEHRIYYDNMDMLGQLGALGDAAAATP
jgi:steroid delta-isomerase-like uncharacterized protein